MAAEKICFKNYLICPDDKNLTKTRKKVNAKSPKKRVYGVDHAYSGDINGDGAGMMSENLGGMSNGALPATFSSNVLQNTPNARIQGQVNGKQDMKKQNRRAAPRKHTFLQWLQYRQAAEEEETTDWDSSFDDEDFPYDPYAEDPAAEEDPFADDDWFNDDYDEERASGDYRPDNNYVVDQEEEEDIDDYDEFDDINGEDELDFEDGAIPTGRFVDFYRGDEDPESDGEFDDDEFDDDESIKSRDGYEEEEEGPGGFEMGQAPAAIGGGANTPKIDRARMLFQQLINRPNMSRGAMIQEFIKQLDVTESTAVSYYERIAKEMGMTNQDEEVPSGNPSSEFGADMNQPVDELPADTNYELSQDDVESQDPNEQGIIRHVPNAHLVYKRQMEDGAFEELWVYNIGDKLNDALKIRREILSGTDIPRGHTRSKDGQQSYTLTTMGNAQLLSITGLSN